MEVGAEVAELELPYLAQVELSGTNKFLGLETLSHFFMIFVMLSNFFSIIVE